MSNDEYGKSSGSARGGCREDLARRRRGQVCEVSGGTFEQRQHKERLVGGVPPDDEAAFRIPQDRARDRAHWNAACDTVEAALVEMKASYGAWTLWPRRGSFGTTTRRVLANGGSRMTNQRGGASIAAC